MRTPIRTYSIKLKEVFSFKGEFVHLSVYMYQGP